jgi:hypothetical protein
MYAQATVAPATGDGPDASWGPEAPFPRRQVPRVQIAGNCSEALTRKNSARKLADNIGLVGINLILPVGYDSRSIELPYAPPTVRSPTVWSSKLSRLLDLSSDSLRLMIRLVSRHAAEYAGLESPVRRPEVDFSSDVEELKASRSAE